MLHCFGTGRAACDEMSTVVVQFLCLIISVTYIPEASELENWKKIFTNGCVVIKITRYEIFTSICGPPCESSDCYYEVFQFMLNSWKDSGGRGVGTGLLLRLERNNYKLEKYKYVWLLINIYGVDRFCFYWPVKIIFIVLNSLVRAAGTGAHVLYTVFLSLSLSLSLSLFVAIAVRFCVEWNLYVIPQGIYRLSAQFTYCQYNLPTASTLFLLSAQFTDCQHNLPTVSTIYRLSAQFTYCQHNLPTASTIYRLSAQFTYCQHNLPTVSTIYRLSTQFADCQRNHRFVDANPWLVWDSKRFP